MKFQKVKTKLIEYFWVAVAGVLNAFSLHTFIYPNTLIPGGFSGISAILIYLFPVVNESLIYFAINIPLLVCSLIFVKGDFTFKTIFATVVCSLSLAVFPENFIFNDATLISTLFGGILIGTSMFIASQFNGSNGGTEVIAKIVAKNHPEIDLSSVVMTSNLIILVGGTFIMVGLKGSPVWIAFYSLIYILMGGNVMRLLGKGLDRPQKFMIVTDKPEPLIAKILSTFKRGVSTFEVFEPDGEISNKKMIMVVVQYRQATHLRKIIAKYDDDAFTFVKEVEDVFSRPTFNRSYSYEKK